MCKIEQFSGFKGQGLSHSFHEEEKSWNFLFYFHEVIINSQFFIKPETKKANCLLSLIWIWSIGMDAFSRFVERLILGDGLTPLENTINLVFLRFSASLFAWNQSSTLPNSSLHLSCSSVAFLALITALVLSVQRFFLENIGQHVERKKMKKES